MLTSLTIDRFTAALAAREPAPGGGSAAALSGLLGASLAALAVTHTRGRAEFAAHAASLAAGEDKLGRLRGDLLALIDRDAAAFSALIAAYDLPRPAESERQARAAALQAAVGEAAAVPLQTARACCAVLAITSDLAGKVAPHVAGDLATGALAAHTGLTGALLNVAANLPALADETLVRAYSDQIRRLRTAGDQLAAAVQDATYGQPAFAVMRE